ncbi:hypothetical protein [Streptomyces sp. NPDC006638]|uniref:hypothetical protein n=1 Tax=Streptomyces sp. NPDC006638 TaxID=3157183 RepID=UPI0033B7CC8B
MGKVWQRTQRDAKKLGKTARVGDVFYTLVSISHHVAPYEDAQLYNVHEVKFMHPLLGGAMISGSQSVEGLVLREGPVYEELPKGYRGLHEAPPQVAGPVPVDKNGRPQKRAFTSAQIAAEERRVEADERQQRGRRGWMGGSLR